MCIQQSDRKRSKLSGYNSKREDTILSWEDYTLVTTYVSRVVRSLTIRVIDVMTETITTNLCLSIM